MSTQTINNEKAEMLSQANSGKGSKVDSALTSSLSVMTLSTNQLLESLGITSDDRAPEEGHSSNDTITLLMLNEERQKIDKEQDKENAFISQLASGVAAEAVQGGASAGPTGKDAVFEAAELMSKVQSNANNSIVKELERQLKMMETQLANLQREAKFWQEFGHYWAEFSSDPSRANLEKLIAELEKFFPNDSDLAKWERYLHWKFYWLCSYECFLDYIRGSLNGLLDKVEDKFDITNAQFQNQMQTGQTLFEHHLQKIIQEISQISMLISILEGVKKGGMSLIFRMEAILMALEEFAIGNNTEKQKQQAKIANTTIQSLTNSLDKMMKALRKSGESHGLWGWIEDFFKSIVKIFKEVIQTASDLFHGNMSKVGKDLLKITGIETIIKAFKNGLKQGFESLLTVVILVAVMSLLGPLGALALPLAMAMMGTKFGEDMNDVAKLVVDAVVALGEAIGAGIDELNGDDKAAKALLKEAKKLGKAMLENPALKALSEVAMVVIIIAAVVSQQYWLAAIMVVLFVATETGLLQKATKDIAGLIAKIPGLSKDAANLIADIIVIVVITALSFGAGSVAAAGDVVANEAGEELAETAVEGATENAVEEGSEEASAQASSQTSETTDNVANQAEKKSSSILEKIGQKIGKRAGMTMLGGGMALGNSTFGLDLAKVINKKDETLEIILEILQEVVAAVFAMIGGLGTIATSAGTLGEQVAKNATRMVQLGAKVQMAGTAVEGVANMGQGGYTILQGMIQKNLAQLKADVTVIESAEEENNAAIKNTSSELKTLMKEFETIVNNMDAPALAGEGVARALLQNA